MDESVSVWKFSLGSTVIVVIAFIFAMIFRISIQSASIVIAIGVGTFIAIWFAKSVGRTPTSKERSQLLWQYGGILALFPILFFVLGYILKSKVPSLPSIFIALLNFLLFPAWAQFCLTGKRMEGFLRKKT
jgi:hypothetical protein